MLVIIEKKKRYLRTGYSGYFIYIPYCEHISRRRYDMDTKKKGTATIELRE